MPNAAASQKSPPAAPAVAQAARILRCLADSDKGLNVTAVARQTGISQSSCFNVLRTLAGEGLVNFDADSKLYTLGLGLVQIASRVLSRSRPAMIRPELAEIARRYGALLALWEIGEDERMVLIDRVYADTPVRIEMRLGQRVPAFAGAVGRCVAAASRLPINQLRMRFKKLIWQSPVSFEEYATDVERAAHDGYAIDTDHYFRGISVVGTAIVDADGRPRMAIGALTITRQLSRDELNELGQALHGIALLAGRIWFPAAATEGSA